MTAPRVRHWAFTRRRDGRFGNAGTHLDGSCGLADCQSFGGDELGARELSDEAVRALWVIGFAICIAPVIWWWLG